MLEDDADGFVIRLVDVNNGRVELVRVKRAASFCSDFCQLYAAGMTWWPGSEIAVMIVGNDLAPMSLFAVSSDGSGQHLISGKLTDLFSPVWSRDGKRVAFVSRKFTPRNDMIFTVWTANSASGRRSLTGQHARG